MEFASPTQIEIKSRTSHGTVLAQAAFFFFILLTTMDRFTLELWQSCFALYAQQFIIDNNLYIGRIFRTSTSY
jgi:hypothetical protein